MIIKKTIINGQNYETTYFDYNFYYWGYNLEL